MRKLGLLAGALAFACPASGHAACTIVTRLPPGAVKVVKNVPYGLGQTGILNIPVGVKDPPVILMAHGADHGAGADGLQSEAEKIAYNTGAVVFNLDYAAGAAVEDFRCAARWIGTAAHGLAHGFDSTQHGAIAFSAGAGPMATAFLASDADHHDSAACPSTAPVFAQTVVLFYGGYNASYAYAQNNRPTGTKWLLANGSDDTSIPVSQTPDMARQLTANGWHVYWSGTVNGLPHGFGVYSFNKWPEELPLACNVNQLFRSLQ